MTCENCTTRQVFNEYYSFCSKCNKPLDPPGTKAQNQHLGLGGIGQNLPNASGKSWHSAQKGKKKWQGSFASRPVNFDSDESDDEVQLPRKEIIRTNNTVDYVVLEEIADVVKFEAMDFVDKLMLTNSPQKMVQLEKVKKHKHVVFDETPTIVEYPKKSNSHQYTLK